MGHQFAWQAPPPANAPSWWPANQPWPPSQDEWRRRRMRRFIGGMVAMFITFVVIVGTAVGIVAAWVASLLGGGGPFTAFFPLPLILLIVFVVAIGSIASGRAAQRIAGALADVMDATERVAAGETSARVRPRGPRAVVRMGEAFNRMAERLEGAERQRRALLADVTHELRTPLTVMQAELEALLDGVHPRDDARISALLEEIRVMSRLVDDLRTLSVADAGALELHREPTDVRDLVEDTVAAFRPRAESAQVTLAMECAADLAPIDVDPVRVRQVLSNLIDNAIRHTPAGGTVTVAAQRSAAGIALEVRDTGSGIAADALPRIFERFTKGAGSPGSGLGLPIARGLVRAHGGEIEATSDGVGRGTIVRFTLPAAEGA